MRDFFILRKQAEQVISYYNAERIKLIEGELRVRKLTWCTRCSCVFSESGINLLLLEGRERYSCGYENSCYGFRDFFELHRVCPKCREEALDKHCTVGEYDILARDQAFFFAFPVKKRRDGCHINKFGRWTKLNDEKCKLPKPPSQLVEKLAACWNLPPVLKQAAI